MPDGFLLVALLAIVLVILGTPGSASTARRIETKTVRYSASSVEDTQRHYHADAVLFTGIGWAVHNVVWDQQAQQPTLVATYARYGLPRALVRFGRYVAAILTAMAVPVVVSVLLDGSGVSAEVGVVVMIAAFVLGIAIGLRLEHPGRGPSKWFGRAVVTFGALLGLLVVFVFVLFFALFGSLVGLYAAAAALGVWLVLRATVAVGRMLAARR